MQLVRIRLATKARDENAPPSASSKTTRKGKFHRTNSTTPLVLGRTSGRLTLLGHTTLVLLGGTLHLLLLLLELSSLSSLGTVVHGLGFAHGLLVLGLDDDDRVGQALAGTLGLTGGVRRRRRGAHDLDLDTEHTLPEQDVASGVVDEVLGGLTGVDHEAVGELHALGTGGAQLAGDDNLATLGAGLHDEAEHTVACTTDGETVEELVAEGLALGDGGETTGLDLGGVEGDRVRGEAVAVSDEAGELGESLVAAFAEACSFAGKNAYLTDPPALLSENLLSVGGADDDVGDGRCDADLNAGVTLLSQLALEEFVQLGVEDTVGDELSALGAVSCRSARKTFVRCARA